MKKQILGLALLAGMVFSGSVFTACSSSDDGGGSQGPVVNGKKLVKMRRDTTYVYTYNSKGQIIMEAIGPYVTNYVYEDNRITRSNGGPTTVYFLENGRIVRDSTYYSSSYYEYDNDGQLTMVREIPTSGSYYSSSSYVKLTWDKGNIVKMEGESTNSYSSLVSEYTYKNEGNVLSINDPSPVDPVLWTQGFFGKRCSNLLEKEVTTINYNDGTVSESTATYDYTSENGVITQMICTRMSDTGRVSTTIVSFTWE